MSEPFSSTTLVSEEPPGAIFEMSEVHVSFNTASASGPATSMMRSAETSNRPAAVRTAMTSS